MRRESRVSFLFCFVFDGFFVGTSRAEVKVSSSAVSDKIAVSSAIVGCGDESAVDVVVYCGDISVDGGDGGGISVDGGDISVDGDDGGGISFAGGDGAGISVVDMVEDVSEGIVAGGGAIVGSGGVIDG